MGVVPFVVAGCGVVQPQGKVPQQREALVSTPVPPSPSHTAQGPIAGLGPYFWGTEISSCTRAAKMQLEAAPSPMNTSRPHKKTFQLLFSLGSDQDELA